MKFDVNTLSGEDAKNIVKSLATSFQATIQNQQTSSQKLISTIRLDLSVERTRNNPLKISFPFVSMRVEEATNTLSSCRVIPVSIDTYQDDTLLRLNDSFEFDNGIASIFITNEAQAGNFMIIKFYTTARVRSGSLVLADNSNTSTTSIGGSIGRNDGLSHLVFFNLNGAIPASSSALMNAITSYNVPIETGTYTPDGGGPVAAYRVPDGYTAEILAAEIDIPTAISSTSWAISLLEVAENSVYANLTAMQAAPLGVCEIKARAMSITVSPIKLFVDAGVSYTNAITPYRGTRNFNSGCLIVPVFTNNTASVTGVFTIRALIRLSRNVGA